MQDAVITQLSPAPRQVEGDLPAAVATLEHARRAGQHQRQHAAQRAFVAHGLPGFQMRQRRLLEKAVYERPFGVGEKGKGLDQSVSDLRIGDHRRSIAPNRFRDDPNAAISNREVFSDTFRRIVAKLQRA